MIPILAATYSFQDVQVAVVAPSASFSLEGSGVSSEGVRIAMIEQKNTMTIGAGGSGMHSLRASKAGKVTISLLKTGLGNAMLNTLYRYQSGSAGNWGGIRMTINNPVSGDNVTCAGGAFSKHTDMTFATEGGMASWELDFIDIDQIVGNGYSPTGL